VGLVALLETFARSCDVPPVGSIAVPSVPRRHEGGQGVVEYGIVLGLSALLALVILVVFGSQVADVVQWIGRTVDATTGGR
jgi:hypothetical protein